MHDSTKQTSNDWIMRPQRLAGPDVLIFRIRATLGHRTLVRCVLHVRASDARAASMRWP